MDAGVGLLTTPIGLTNTHSVGAVRDAIVSFRDPGLGRWSLPVVGETYDGFLNDIAGQHVRPDHVHAALETAAAGAVAEGNVGGGTGMISHGFKGGIGTASRIVAEEDRGFTLGVLVQANYGARRRFRVDGVPVGERIGADAVPLPGEAGTGAGSNIVLVATDAPLFPGQCDRVAQRACLGIGRTGGMGEHSWAISPSASPPATAASRRRRANVVSCSTTCACSPTTTATRSSRPRSTRPRRRS